MECAPHSGSKISEKKMLFSSQTYKEKHNEKTVHRTTDCLLGGDAN